MKSDKPPDPPMCPRRFWEEGKIVLNENIILAKKKKIKRENLIKLYNIQNNYLRTLETELFTFWRRVKM